jgi:hypothetical protein
MDHSDPAREGNAAYMKMQRDIYYQAVHSLCGTLPRPPGEHNDDFERRYRVAVAHVASLLPVNADEISLAVHCVAASAQAEECLRCVVEEATDLPTIAMLWKQAASMMRESRGSHAMLLRVQAVRHKREADNKTCEQDEWTEHRALGMMTDALDDRLRPWAYVAGREAVAAATPRAAAAEDPAATHEPAPAAEPAPALRPAAAASPPQAATPEQDNAPAVALQAPAGFDTDCDTSTDHDIDPDTDSDTGADDDADIGFANMPSDTEMLRLLESLPTPNGFDPRVMERLESIVNGKPRKPLAG